MRQTYTKFLILSDKKSDKEREQDQERGKESDKWLSALRGVETALAPYPSSCPSCRILLVQDREADIYSFFSAPRRADIDLLIRATYPRRLDI